MVTQTVIVQVSGNRKDDSQVQIQAGMAEHVWQKPRTDNRATWSRTGVSICTLGTDKGLGLLHEGMSSVRRVRFLARRETR